jgi:hypothetical protein
MLALDRKAKATTFPRKTKGTVYKRIAYQNFKGFYFSDSDVYLTPSLAENTNFTDIFSEIDNYEKPDADIGIFVKSSYVPDFTSNIDDWDWERLSEKKGIKSYTLDEIKEKIRRNGIELPKGAKIKKDYVSFMLENKDLFII